MTFPDLDPVGDIKPGVSAMDIKRKETPAVSEGGKALETNGTHDDFIEVFLDPCHKDTHPKISSEVNIGTEGPNEEYRRGNMHNTTFEGTVNNDKTADRITTLTNLMANEDETSIRTPQTGPTEGHVGAGKTCLMRQLLRKDIKPGGPDRTNLAHFLAKRVKYILGKKAKGRKRIERGKEADMCRLRLRRLKMKRENTEHIIYQRNDSVDSGSNKTADRITTWTNLMNTINFTLVKLHYLTGRNRAFLLLLALLFCTVLIKSSLKKQSLVKYSSGKAAMMVLWTSGDVEKHPGPPLNDMKTFRELFTRLVKASQGNKVADWSTAPACWDENVVSFKDINNRTNTSDNEEKFAMFYMALYTVIKIVGYVPSWCIKEMTCVETGNAAELRKCQTARKIRELLDQHDPSDHEDILRGAGYPRQGGNISTQTVKGSAAQPPSSTNRQQQRQKKWLVNLPEFKPIAEITNADTALKIANACMRRSKNGGKYQNGNPHQQTATKRPAATIPVAPKRPRMSPTATSTRPSTSSDAQPNKSSTLCGQPSNDNSRGTPVTTAPKSQHQGHSGQPSNDDSRGTPNTSASNSQQPDPSGQPSNDDSRGTPVSTAPYIQHPGPSGQTSRGVPDSTAAPNRQQPRPSGQTLNPISLPSEDLDDLGFPSDIDLDKFVTQILKDDIYEAN